MTTILAAVDDSVAAGPVVAAAQAVAPLFGASVEAVHVGDAGQTARACAERAGVPFRTVAGRPREALLELAQEGTSMVVVGTNDSAGASAPVGHLSLELAEELAVPLLVVPPHCEPAARVSRVLVALKGQPGRARPLLHTLDVVAGAELDLTVVHVDDEHTVPAFSESAAHEHEEFAQEFLSRYWPVAPRARLALPIGDPADEVLAVAEDVRPDVLVAGWPRGAGPGHGRVVRELLRRNRSPVLLVAVAPQPAVA